MKKSELKKIIKESIKELQEKELVQTFDSPVPGGGCICVYLDTDTGNYSTDVNHNDCECTMAASNDPNNTNACCAAEGLVHVGPVTTRIHRR
jgi:hypothetical protein